MLKTCVFVSIRYGRTIRHYECFYREAQAGFKCFLNKKHKNLNRFLAAKIFTEPQHCICIYFSLSSFCIFMTSVSVVNATNRSWVERNIDSKFFCVILLKLFCREWPLETLVFFTRKYNRRTSGKNIEWFGRYAARCF